MSGPSDASNQPDQPEQPGQTPSSVLTVMPAREPQWPASIALLVGAALLLAVPEHIQVGPSSWLIAGGEALAAIVLAVGWPDRLKNSEREALRNVSIALIAVITVVNAASLVLLVRYLLDGGDVDGPRLVRSAISVWGTNVIAYACWFWEIDGGGPQQRRDETIPTRDFLYVQMTDDGRPYAPTNWYPRFFDYLYLSFTNATAFSPTDTLPLTPRAKGLMAVQSLIALVTLAVIAARAVNILH